MRYALREEFFGALCYDSVDKDYIHLDHLALRMLRAPREPLSETDLQQHETSREEVQEVLDDLAQREMIDNFKTLPNKPLPRMLSAPTRIFLEITYRCPEHCEHCYTDSGERRAGELDRADKFSIVDQMAQMGCYRLSIAGGEPLVDRDFFPVVERAISHYIDVSFSTSGIPVTARTAQQLAALDIRTINVSLDGWDESSYGSVRGTGRFKYMLRGVNHLRRHYQGKLAAKCTLMTTNILGVERIIRLAEDLGFDVVKFNCVREAGRATQAQSLIPTQDEYLDVVRRLAEIYNQRDSKVKLVLPVNPYQKMGEDQPDFIGELGFGCYAGKECFCITAEGQIQPCTSFGPTMYVDGNVRERRLIDAWLNGGAMRAFRDMTGSSACQTCPSYSGCRGGCYLRSLTAYGDIGATDPYCYERRNDPWRTADAEASRVSGSPRPIAALPLSGA